MFPRADIAGHLELEDLDAAASRRDAKSMHGERGLGESWGSNGIGFTVAARSDPPRETGYIVRTN